MEELVLAVPGLWADHHVLAVRAAVTGALAHHCLQCHLRHAVGVLPRRLGVLQRGRGRGLPVASVPPPRRLCLPQRHVPVKYGRLRRAALRGWVVPRRVAEPMRAVLGVPDGGGDAARRRWAGGLRLFVWLLHDGLSVPLLAVLGDSLVLSIFPPTARR